MTEMADILENPGEVENFLKIKIPEHLVNLLKFHQFSSINILSELNDENITTIKQFNREVLYEMLEGQEDEIKKYYGPVFDDFQTNLNFWMERRLCLEN